MKINSDFKKVAISAAKEAGGIIEKNFKKITQVFFKKDSSLLTKIDLKAEKAILRLIKKKFPSHNILSEEKGGEIGEKYTWVIDPLDGTTNYSRGIPFFSTSIALLYKGELVLGVVFNPIGKEFYFAEKGKGAFLNGKKIKVAREHILSKAVILFDKYRAREDFIEFCRILGSVGGKCATFRRLGSVALSFGYLAAGKLDAFFTAGHNLWDFAAGILIIREAGGKVTNLKGEEWNLGDRNIMAANKELHRQLLRLIKK